MNKLAIVISVVAVVAAISLGLYANSLRWERQELERFSASTRNELDRLRQELAQAKKQLENSRAESRMELQKAAREKAALEEQLARAVAAREDEAAPIAPTIVEPARRDRDLAGESVEQKPVLEVLKQVFDSPAMAQAMRMGIPMIVGMRYGELLDRLMLRPEQRAELEKILGAALETEFLQLQEALAAWPDLSVIQGLKAQEERQTLELLAEAGKILRPDQLSDFEQYYRNKDEREATMALDMQIQMAGLTLTESQTEAFRQILAEEHLASSGLQTQGMGIGVEEFIRLSNMTVGDVIEAQQDQSERVAKRLEAILPPGEVDKYRAFAARQLEQMKMSIQMFSAQMGQ